jgi:hypothetical protein
MTPDRLVDAKEWNNIVTLASQTDEGSPARALLLMPRPTVEEFCRNVAYYRRLFEA